MVLRGIMLRIGILLQPTYGTAIFQGDLVVPTYRWTLNVMMLLASSGAVKPIGVFNGVFYTDPTTSKPTFSNYYPGSINC